MKPSINMQAVLVLAKHKLLGQILIPQLNIPYDSINWDGLNYHSQPGGVQTALSWAHCLFCDELPAAGWNYRDPFASFGSLDREVQSLILEAQAVRHGYVKITLEDKPMSSIERIIRDREAQFAGENRKSKLSVLKKQD